MCFFIMQIILLKKMYLKVFFLRCSLFFTTLHFIPLSTKQQYLYHLSLLFAHLNVYITLKIHKSNWLQFFICL